MGQRHLEDFAVGQTFGSARLTMDKERIRSFAAEFDPQPFHLDEAAACQSIFRGLAASGWHTAAVTMRLLVEGGAPIAGGVIGAGGDVSWPMPTRPGDLLQVETEILEIRPSKSKPQQGMVIIKAETFNQHRQVVQRLVAKLVVPRRPQS